MQLCLAEMLEIWSLHDTDSSGSLSAAEAVRFCDDLVHAATHSCEVTNAELCAKARELYAALDSNRSGILVWSELVGTAFAATLAPSPWPSSAGASEVETPDTPSPPRTRTSSVIAFGSARGRELLSALRTPAELFAIERSIPLPLASALWWAYRKTSGRHTRTTSASALPLPSGGATKRVSVPLPDAMQLSEALLFARDVVHRQMELNLVRVDADKDSLAWELLARLGCGASSKAFTPLRWPAFWQPRGLHLAEAKALAQVPPPPPYSSARAACAWKALSSSVDALARVPFIPLSARAVNRAAALRVWRAYVDVETSLDGKKALGDDSHAAGAELTVEASTALLGDLAQRLRELGERETSHGISMHAAAQSSLPMQSALKWIDFFDDAAVHVDT